MYYNTNNLSGDMLREAEKLTSKQDQIVFGMFTAWPERLFDSHEVESELRIYPRSSIVRAMNTLMKLGLIVKTDKKRIGKYGQWVYLYKLATKIDLQLTLGI